VRVRRFSASVERAIDLGALHPGPEPGIALPSRWQRILPRVRGVLVVLLGFCALLGTRTLLRILRIQPAETKDPVSFLWLPRLILVPYGVIQILLGRPFAEWPDAWNALSDAQQWLIVYGLLFGGPILLF
jgi:hypothetical protein